MKFVDREKEMSRLDSILSRSDGALAVVYGRRRIGKTRLLLEWCKKRGGLYTVADQSSSSVQRRYMAEAVSQVFEGFSDVEYPNWRSLLKNLCRRASAQRWNGPLVIDELPYLVAQDPTLPSVLQAWLDHDVTETGLSVAFAGSSQHMMHGLTLDSSSPVFGRASQVMKLEPIPPSFITAAAGLRNAQDIIKFFGIFGGIPRYWELASGYGKKIDDAVDDLVLDPLAPLHAEPDRLLAMELPPALSLRPILDVIGAGAHRLSEIGGRIGKPATSLSKPMTRLIELGLVRREIPFGESERSSKRSLYKLNDPFLRTWFRVVAPKRAFLAAATPASRRRFWKTAAQSLYAQGFEELCRRSVAGLGNDSSFISEHGVFGPAGRFWAARGNEWDVVALSEDGKKLLLGEVKWRERDFSADKVESAISDLFRKGVPVNSKWNNLEIVHAIFVPKLTAGARKRRYKAHVVEGEKVIQATA